MVDNLFEQIKEEILTNHNVHISFCLRFEMDAPAHHSLISGQIVVDCCQLQLLCFCVTPTNRMHDCDGSMFTCFQSV